MIHFQMRPTSIVIAICLVLIHHLEYSDQVEDYEYQTLDEMLRDADSTANKADYSDKNGELIQSSADRVELQFDDDNDKFDYDPEKIDIVSHRLLAMLNKTKSRAEGLRDRLIYKREKINRKLSREPSLTLSRLDAKLAEKIDELNKQIAPSEESFSRNDLNALDYCTCANNSETKNTTLTNGTSKTPSQSPRVLIIK